MLDQWVAQLIVGVCLSALGGVVGRLTYLVLDNRDRLVRMVSRLMNQEREIARVEKGMLTEECVRRVIDAALEKRDKMNESRRVEWDKLRDFEISRAVEVAVEKLVSKMIRSDLRPPKEREGEESPS